MLSSVLASLLLVAAPVQRADTVIPVDRGTRLEVVNMSGDVEIRSWDRDAVGIDASRAFGDGVQVARTASVLRVRSASQRGTPRPVDYRITVPAWMAVRVNGMNSSVSVDGAAGDVNVETVRGSITLRGGDGLLTLRSVQGSIDVRDARGRIDLYTVNDGIRVSGATGDLTAETVNGNITLERVESANVDVGTVNGSLTYHGAIHDGGRYQFATHNGGITLRVPDGANATVNVATMNGHFESAFPVTLAPGRRTTRFEFSIGTGSARVDLQSFNGTVRLARAGDP